MRLLTHNFLKSNVKNTSNGYPLKIEPTEIIYEESVVDRIMVEKMSQKIDYKALTLAYSSIKQASSEGGIADFSWPDDLPETLPDGDLSEELIILLHQILFDIHVINGKLSTVHVYFHYCKHSNNCFCLGSLICPGTGRKFPIVNSIPNMILHEDEL